ncbi:MAG: 2-succinyl-5-enolpyruvyl-6-hydroxy-3-cyclohexene-1-carboxylic-acid synthase, partial [Planctomycetota bacterium]
ILIIAQGKENVAIAEELARAGVTRVIGCPGSRNSPLLFALSAVFGDRLHMAIDERGAAFHALGMAKVGVVTAVCVTSGTAAANLLPAVCEAHASGQPLILITADRPADLHGVGAPQTMEQRSLFGVFATAVALAEPTATDHALCSLRELVSRSVQEAHGPVQFNVPLRDPLPPLPDPTWTRPTLSTEAERGRAGPFVRIESRPSFPDASIAAPFLRPGLRGLIVAGSESEACAPLIPMLASLSGYPVLADAISGLRRPAVPNLVASLDALADSALGREQADVIIRIGAPPLARASYEWVAKQRCPQLVLGGDRNRDFIGTATMQWPLVNDAFVAELGRRCATGDATWTARWKAAEKQAQEQRQRTASAQGWSEPAAYALACAQSDFPLLWLASSMPVRHANLHVSPSTQRQRVLSNRGVNGIDGTVASFLGATRASGQRGLCLIGDLALLHDLNSLALASGTRGGVLVVNNGGGGIFDALPVAQVDGYRRLVRTDHDLDFSHAAAQFRLPYRRCAAIAELSVALAEAATSESMLLIECALTGRDMIADHRAVLAAMR